MNWKTIDSAPLGVVVDTIIRDTDGERNHQPMKASQRAPDCRVMWWFPDGSVYVYYTPTHWREMEKQA
jgi:hypothetical protein